MSATRPVAIRRASFEELIAQPDRSCHDANHPNTRVAKIAPTERRTRPLA